MCHIHRKQLMQHPRTVCLLQTGCLYIFSNDFWLHIQWQYTKSYRYEDVPADWNGNVEDGYSSSACIVCKQVCYDCRCYCRVATLSNANDRSQKYENYKVLQIIATVHSYCWWLNRNSLSCTNMLTNDSNTFRKTLISSPFLLVKNTSSI